MNFNNKYFVTRSNAGQFEHGGNHYGTRVYVNPFGNGSTINIDELWPVYLALMRSIQKVGTEANFNRNKPMVNFIVCNNANERCITDLSDEWSIERAQLFRPIFNGGAFYQN